ncbi:MAG: DUF4135 domain-containing protein [Chlamydiae bacterium]|nr:DUF4135 domain-containing protein [Chlamydiota bacterium]
MSVRRPSISSLDPIPPEQISKEFEKTIPLSLFEKWLPPTLRALKDFWSTRQVSFSSTLTNSVETMVERCSSLGSHAKQKEKEVKAFVSKNWKDLQLPSSCENGENHQFLTAKILKIILHDKQSNETKKKIINNILVNLKEYLTKAIDQVKKDTAEDLTFQKKFQISSDHSIVKVFILGNETHNKGKTPLCIELENNKKIVFKPRSMINEELITGKENSLFAKTDLPTYIVYDKDNKYGYSEWLENKKEENTFMSKEEVEKYLLIFCKMDRLLNPLKIDDQHYENIITSKKKPHLIDLEVINPFANDTGLLTLGEHSGFLFDNENSRNRIWFGFKIVDEKTLSELDKPEFSTSDSMTIFSQGHLLENTIQKTLKNRALKPEPFSPEEKEAIQFTRQELDKYPHRILLMGTRPLNLIIQQDPKEGFRIFLDDLKNSLDSKFKLQISTKDLENQFTKDVMNNDIPIFYYMPDTGEVYYGDFLLAIKSTPTSEQSDNVVQS